MANFKLYQPIVMLRQIKFTCIFLLALMLFVIVFPWVKKYNRTIPGLHSSVPTLQNLVIPTFKNIAVALDFTSRDEKIVAYALAQGNADTIFTLIHVVESASAHMDDGSYQKISVPKKWSMNCIPCT